MKCCIRGGVLGIWICDDFFVIVCVYGGFFVSFVSFEYFVVLVNFDEMVCLLIDRNVVVFCGLLGMGKI